MLASYNLYFSSELNSTVLCGALGRLFLVLEATLVSLMIAYQIHCTLELES